MPIPLRNGGRGLQRLLSLKYYNVQKWENRFSLGLDTTEKYALFKAFAPIICIFGSDEPQTESTFPFQYSIIFEK